jgi:outer membrane protein assembly factor BamB
MTMETSTATAGKQGAVSWRAPAAIVALLAVVLLFVAYAPDWFRGMQVVATLAAVGAASLAMLTWFVSFSRLSLRTRKIGVASLAAVVALAAACVRVDGFDGAMLPLLAWRWTPTAEEQFAARETTTAAPDRQSAPALVLSTFGENYPGFLGADRLAVVRDIELQPDWKEHPPEELWRQPVGLGWSAFAVAGDVAITQEQRGEDEAVVCYELQTGRQRWEHLDPARFSETLGGDGPRATPTIYEGRVYALGATGKLNCLDASTGERLWSRNILEDAAAENISWGMSSSPLVVDQTVVVCAGGQDGKSLWAYKIDSGEVAWHAGSDKAAYASPMLTKLGGVPQIVMYNATAVVGHDPSSGNVLWRHVWHAEQEIKCSQPVALADFDPQLPDNQLLISSGYAIGSELIEVTRDSQGKLSVEPRWESRQLRAKFSNNIVVDGHVYGLDEGILACLDLNEGKRLWKQGRYGYGQLLQVGKLLLIQAEAGDVVLLEVSPQGPRELSRLAALSSKTWNNPALAGELLLVRNDREAVCYRLPVKKPAARSTPSESASQ